MQKYLCRAGKKINFKSGPICEQITPVFNF